MNFPLVTSAFLVLFQGVENKCQQTSVVQVPELPPRLSPLVGQALQLCEARGPGPGLRGLSYLLKADRAWRVSRTKCGPLASDICVKPRAGPDYSGAPEWRFQAVRQGEHSQPKGLFLPKPLPSNISKQSHSATTWGTSHA